MMLKTIGVNNIMKYILIDGCMLYNRTHNDVLGNLKTAEGKLRKKNKNKNQRIIIDRDTQNNKSTNGLSDR